MLRRIAAAVALLLAAAAPVVAGERRPVVVELFTSQGCNSCPPADALLAELAKREDVLPLAFHVDYWDYLGWKDPHASRANTERQRSYSRALATRFTYTPQMVIDGAAQEVGSKRAEVEALIAKASAERASGPEVAVADGRVRIGAAPAGAPAAVWVAYFRRSVANEVPRGENAGKRLGTTNAVRELRLLGGWDGKAVELALGAAPPAGCDGGAILVQRAGPGAILAARVFDAAR
jgi:hypothetical protein